MRACLKHPKKKKSHKRDAKFSIAKVAIKQRPNQFHDPIIKKKKKNRKSEGGSEREELTEFVVLVRGKLGSSELGEHLSGILESISEIVGVLRRIGIGSK